MALQILYIKETCMDKCMDVYIHTKTVIPCSLHSIATAQSRRLTIIHDTENFSGLSPAKHGQEEKNSHHNNLRYIVKWKSK